MSDLYPGRAAVISKVVELLAERGIKVDQEKVEKEWWSNIRTTGGYGLTISGHSAFLAAGLEWWDVSISSSHLILPTTQLNMDKYLPCPYYVSLGRKGGTVRLFDSRVVVMVQLYGGLKIYLDNLASKKSKLLGNGSTTT